ncbi:ATP-binding protein [Paenibacillus filicis]|uniref:ATP-binding protein n=1 Tax=Paenibacillus filicis TaxID=669464 RepID=A0ABU9DW66_9BACL
METVESLGKVLKTLMPELTLVSEIGRRQCEGCGNEVVVYEAPILGGPDKGKMVQYTRGIPLPDNKIGQGCICWENEQAREAKRDMQERRIKRIVDRYSTVNPDLEAASFESFETSSPILQESLKLARSYVDGFQLTAPMNLLFAGLYGLGKSHLTYSICKALRVKGFTAVFMSVPKLLTIIKSTYNKDSDFTEAELLDVLSKVDLLALDDIGAEKARREEQGETWATEKLFEIIDGRSGRSTVYTTNLRADELATKVGQRNFSRMMMNTKPFRFEGEDYRIKNKRF